MILPMPDSNGAAGAFFRLHLSSSRQLNQRQNCVGVGTAQLGSSRQPLHQVKSLPIVVDRLREGVEFLRSPGCLQRITYRLVPVLGVEPVICQQPRALSDRPILIRWQSRPLFERGRDSGMELLTSTPQ